MKVALPLLLLAAALPPTTGHLLDPKNPDSVKGVASAIAKKLISYYPGDKPGGIPGLFGDPYYWWEAGAVMGGLIDYWHFTGDTTYNTLVKTAMLHQTGPDNNFMPPNQTNTLGNDDQGFWALAAMAAAERNFPPPESGPDWLALAQAVFNSQAERWDMDSCNGGLRWQIFRFNRGYTYKNTISNGCFFILAARLARYTRNATYVDWAHKTWDWVRGVGLISPKYEFFDGARPGQNCSGVDRGLWSYNPGIFLAGAAYLWNHTQGQEWKERIDGIIDQTNKTFFEKGIMVERTCEPSNSCNVDQRSFKAYLSRFMGMTAALAPWTAENITSLLRTSAVAAASHCSNGQDSNTCGLKWTLPTGEWEGKWGVGEQLCALETVQNLLAVRSTPPVTRQKGGIAKGDPAAGTRRKKEEDDDDDVNTTEVGEKDRIGGWISTITMGLFLAGLSAFMMWPIQEKAPDK